MAEYKSCALICSEKPENEFALLNVELQIKLTMYSYYAIGVREYYIASIGWPSVFIFGLSNNPKPYNMLESIFVIPHGDYLRYKKAGEGKQLKQVEKICTRTQSLNLNSKDFQNELIAYLLRKDYIIIVDNWENPKSYGKQIQTNRSFLKNPVSFIHPDSSEVTLWPDTEKSE